MKKNKPCDPLHFTFLSVSYSKQTLYYRIIALLCFMVYSNPAQSQLDNYWSWNFNTPSMLMAGSVVGGSAGPSAIFYNPSTINHESTPSLSVSANIVSLVSFKGENLAGDGLNVDKLFVKIQPKFISYLFSTKNEKFGMEVASFVRSSHKLDFSLQYNDEIDVIDRTQGLENYSGFLKYVRSYEDIYVGYGLSYKLSDSFYIGASSFLSTKFADYEYEQETHAFQKGDSVNVSNTVEAKYISERSLDELLDYWDLSLIFKLGAIYEAKNNRFSIGANITFPNLHLGGGADVRRSVTHTNIYDDSAGIFTPNEFFLRMDEEAKTNIKSPFSSALGVQYITKDLETIISLTLEYFNNIDSYSLFQPNSVHNSSSDLIMGNIPVNDFISYSSEAKTVTNLGIGFKQYISPNLSISGGFRTDFTNGVSDEDRLNEELFQINRIHLDKYHFTMGTIAQIKKFHLVTGLQYTLAHRNGITQIVNFTEPIEYNPTTKQALVGEPKNNTNIKINELALFFGFTFDLKK